MAERSASLCCWCKEPLKRSRPEMPWMCHTVSCWERCRPWGITLEETTRKGQGTGRIAQWLFCPTPKQTEFCEQQRTTKYTLFGGAKAVAKSYVLRWLAYHECLRLPGIRILLLRRTYSELEQSHLLDMPGEAEKLSLVGAKYTSSDRAFSFSNGSLIKAGHCETDSDVSKYLSSQWDVVIFDELVTFGLEMFLAIASCARTAKAAVMAEGGAKVWAATNPGGRGAAWVKDLFVDHAPDPEQFPSYSAVEWSYIPGRLEDNPYIEPGYRQTLMNLPPILRRQWLDGDWNAFSGQFFDFEPAKHVGPGASGVRDLTVKLGLDWGSASPGCVLFGAAMPDGHVSIFDEIKFQRQTVKDVAEAIKDRCKDWGLDKVPLIYADPALKIRTGQIGEDYISTFARYGVTLVPVSNERNAGWQRVHEALSVDPSTGTPWMTFHPRCKYLIRTLPLMVQDKNDPEDLDTGTDDHPSDALRYLLMGGLRPGTKAKTVQRMPVNSWGWWRTFHQKQEQGTGVLA